jgi:hypothetical protein
MYSPGPADELPPPYHDDVIRKEHELIHHRIDQLDAHVKRVEMKHDVDHEHKIDRWTDPKNAPCKMPHDGYIGNFTMNPSSYQYASNVNAYLSKPLPHYISEENLIEFLSKHRHEYICPCYNCMLHDLFETKTRFDGSDGKHYKPILCPLDSDCTCMTKAHRLDFKHSIGVGLIKGRDKELSIIQRFYVKHATFRAPHLVYVDADVKRNPDGTIMFSVGSVKPPHHPIINCTRRDGLDLYQYKKHDSHAIYDTPDNLFVLTNSYEYPPREPATFNTSEHHLRNTSVLVPIEKYLADTQFLGRASLRQKRARRTTGTLQKDTKKKRRSRRYKSYMKKC